jgi:hypothetical protein
VHLQPLLLKGELKGLPNGGVIVDDENDRSWEAWHGGPAALSLGNLLWFRIDMIKRCAEPFRNCP